MAEAVTTKVFSVWKGSALNYAGITAKNSNRLYFAEKANGELPGNIYIGTTKYGATVKAVASFPTTGQEEGTIYLGPNGESRYWGGATTQWVTIGYPVLSSTVGLSSASTNANVPTAKAVYDYVENRFEDLTSGLGRLLPAVQDITALKGLGAANSGITLEDKDMVLVENTGCLYRYDDSSTATDDGDLIVQSEQVQTGRWLKMTTAADVKAGTAIAISNNTVAVKYDTSKFAVDGTSGNLTLSTSVTQSIDDAQTAADDAQEDATQALADAAAAQSAADAAQSTANTALANASTAQSAADAAQDAADDAQAAADAAQSSADAAQTSANTAQSAAEAAQSSADAAQTSADTAQTAADTAQSAAEAAQEDATQALTNAATALSAAQGKIPLISPNEAGKLVVTKADGSLETAGFEVGGSTITLGTGASSAKLTTEQAVANAIADLQQDIADVKMYWYEGTDTTNS